MSMLESPSPIHSHSPGGVDEARSAGMALPTRKILLGEELPIFCEKCGYALHGLPQMVCDHCTIRQFKCPECAHHQPINTLRPAAQKLLGRLRATALVLLVVFKLNFFGWLLFAWFVGGAEMAYQYDYQSYRMNMPGTVGGAPRTRNYSEYWVPQRLNTEEMVGMSLLGLGFGMFGRMLLLRWRRGYVVGAVMGALAAIALVLGGYLVKANRDIVQSFLVGDFLLLLGMSAVCVMLGASVVWGVWTALVHVFLPKRASTALLEWQQSLSDRPVAALGRE